MWLLLAGIIILAIVAYRMLPSSGSTSADSAHPSRPPVPVSAVKAVRGDLDRFLSAIGTVTPFNTVTVKTRVDGQIMSVDFKEGEFVKQGQLLVEIDPRPFDVQLKQAEGQMAKDQAALSQARADLKRNQYLYEKDALPKQQLDVQATTVKQDAATLVADQAAIDNAKLQLTYSRITAPIGGRIGLRLADPGNIVHATDTQGLAVITQLEPIAALFNIPEDDLPKVLSRMRDGASLPVQAWDREFKINLAAGDLLTTDNQIDTATGTIRLKAQFPNTDHMLFPNQFVNVRLLEETLENQVLIPAAAVQRSGLGTFVYVVKPDKTVQVRNVMVGATEGEITAIASGVSPDEIVVIDGLDRLQPGARVNVQMAANRQIVKQVQ